MITPETIAPYLFSFILGFLCLNIIFQKEKNINTAVKFIFSLAIGLGLSASITFLSFILFDQLVPFFVLLINTLLLLILTYYNYSLRAFSFKIKMPGQKKFFRNCVLLGIFVLFFLPLINQCLYYAHGGWDAWSVWNVKAKFMYLGESSWKNIFKPELWRSSPHYPLFLPLINVWGWIFTQSAVYYIPQMTALVFTVLIAGLLYFGIKDLTKSPFSLIPVLLFISSPFVVKQCVSQYCDLIFGFYLFGCIYSLIKTKEDNSLSFAITAGILLGLLTFTKGEGLLAAGLVTLFALPYLWLKNPHNEKLSLIIYFLVSALFASMPLIYFKLLFAPDNVTFTNGLISQTHPSTFPRLKAIFMYYFFELKNPKWDGLLLLILAILIFHYKKLLSPRNSLISLFLLSYFAIITFYYYVNTQFEIIWWLNVTLGRVIFAVLPVILFLAFALLLPGKNK